MHKLSITALAFYNEVGWLLRNF